MGRTAGAAQTSRWRLETCPLCSSVFSTCKFAAVLSPPVHAVATCSVAFALCCCWRGRGALQLEPYPAAEIPAVRCPDPLLGRPATATLQSRSPRPGKISTRRGTALVGVLGPKTLNRRNGTTASFGRWSYPPAGAF